MDLSTSVGLFPLLSTTLWNLCHCLIEICIFAGNFYDDFWIFPAAKRPSQAYLALSYFLYKLWLMGFAGIAVIALEKLHPIFH